MKINSFNEWDPLKEVILGSADKQSAVLTWKSGSKIHEKNFEKAKKLSKEAYPKWLVDEVNEDLDEVKKIFERKGIKVFRPKVFDINAVYTSPYGWSSTGNNIYNVRDLHLIVGNNVIESASPHKERYFEATALYDIWYDYFNNGGFRWLVNPKPRLDGEVLVPYFKKEEDRILTNEDNEYKRLTNGRVEKLHKLTEREILFEAANTVRMGKDILYLISSSGNEVGARWLQTILGNEYKIHTTRDIYRSSHIDSTILCLRPGLVLINSTRVNKSNCPKLFDKWDKIWFTDVAPMTEEEINYQKNYRDKIYFKLKELGFDSNLQLLGSPWVGMNVLSLDKENLLIDKRQTKLIKELEKYKINPIPIALRHCYTHGGGIHCATLDTVREGKLESYF